MLVADRPEKSWDWYKLCRNPSINSDFLEYCMENGDKTGYYFYPVALSWNPNLTMGFIKRHANLKWNVSDLSALPHFDPYLLKDLYTDDWENYTLSTKIDINFVAKNRDIIRWCYKGLSSNLSLTTEFIDANPDKEFDWRHLTRHPCIDLNYIKAHPERSWTLVNFVYNPNFNIDWLLYLREQDSEIFNNRDTLYQASRHPNITMDDILNHGDIPWHYGGVASNPNINIKFIRTLRVESEPLDPSNYVLGSRVMVRIGGEVKKEEYVCGGIYNYWCCKGEVVCGRYGTSPNNVLVKVNSCTVLRVNPKKIECVSGHRCVDCLSWGVLSLNESVTMDMIEDNLDLPWCYGSVSLNPNITIDFIRKHDDRVDFVRLSRNSNLEFGWVTAYPDRNWDFMFLSSHEKLTIEIVRALPDAKWDYKLLSTNSNISVREMLKNMDLPWCHKGMSLNSGLTYEDVVNHPKIKWDYRLISGNINNFKKNTAHHYSTARKERCLDNLNKIKEELIKVTWAPNRMMDWCLDMDGKLELANA